MVRLGEVSAAEPCRAPRARPSYERQRAAKEIPKADHIRGCTTALAAISPTLSAFVEPGSWERFKRATNSIKGRLGRLEFGTGQRVLGLRRMGSSGKFRQYLVSFQIWLSAEVSAISKEKRPDQFHRPFKHESYLSVTKKFQGAAHAQ